MKRHTISRRLLVLPVVLALAFSAVPAYAGSSTSDTYNKNGDVLDQTVSPVNSSGAAPVTAAQPASGSSLPFTGFDVTLLIAGGIVLLGVGITMRRVSRPRLR